MHGRLRPSPRLPDSPGPVRPTAPSQPVGFDPPWLTRMGRALQRALPIAALSVAVVGAPILIFQPEGLPRVRSLEKELANVNGENADLRRDVTHLRAEVQDLRDNPAAVERIARDRLGLVRTSEVVFQFAPTKRPR